MLSIKDLNPRTEQLERRATTCGLLFIVGLMNAVLCILFNTSTNSNTPWGPYVMAGGFAGYVIYKIRYYACVIAHRRKAGGARLKPVIHSGGIR
ncbi:MAG TPA: hypothetical protein VN450_04525 [Candidatus Methylomirabilis sp.]|nr:hypothetical protein [Candidatus Methylomirabilis sp.]